MILVNKTFENIVGKGQNAENIVEKEKMLVNSIFFFSHNVSALSKTETII